MKWRQVALTPDAIREGLVRFAMTSLVGPNFLPNSRDTPYAT
jgi:hypothetical protein